MEIDFLIVADAVEAVNGKLYMLGGGWHQVTLSQFPAPVRIGIALGLLVPLSDMSEKHQLQVTIFDPNNRPVAQMQAEIGTRPPTRPAAVPSRFAIALNIGFQLPSAGVYRVLALIDSHIRRETSFEAILVVPSLGN